MTAVFPGTFDPVTIGHMDIIRRFRRLWPEYKLIIAVAAGENAGKEPLFTLKERIDQIRALTSDIGHIEVAPFSGLVAEFAHKAGARLIVRGLRDAADFDYEIKMSFFNRRLAPEIETIFIPSAPEHTIVSSSAARVITGLGGRADWMLPELIQTELRKKLGDKE